MNQVPYRLRRPAKRSSFVVFASPHSGCHYPTEMVQASPLSPLALRSSEDAFVDRLFETVPDFGAVFLSAVFPRAWLDLNRRADELDPAVIEGVRQSNMNPRVLSGLGVIPRVVANGQCIYNGKISEAEANRRIKTIWQPYHQMLETLLIETRALFGRSLLIDCHSMPREALNMTTTSTGVRPQIVIGDRFGSSARTAMTQVVEDAFRAEGFDVIRNTPFAGAYITQHYGRPFQNQNVLQVEIDRSLYMNETTLEPNDAYEDVRAALRRAAQRISQYGESDASLAAE